MLTGKCIIERRYVLRELFVNLLFVCLSNKIGVWCVLLSIAVLLLMCWYGLLILCFRDLSGICLQV